MNIEVGLIFSTLGLIIGLVSLYASSKATVEKQEKRITRLEDTAEHNSNDIIELKTMAKESLDLRLTIVKLETTIENRMNQFEMAQNKFSKQMDNLQREVYKK